MKKLFAVMIAILLSLTISVASAESLEQTCIINPGFELDAATTFPTGWTITSETESNNVCYTEAGGHNSDYRLTHWGQEAYKVCTSQTVSNLECGNYNLSVWVRSSGGQNSCEVSVAISTGEELSVPIYAASEWTQITIQDIPIDTGECTIMLTSDANSGNWASFDDVELIKSDVHVINGSFENGYGQNIPGWVIDSPEGGVLSAYVEEGGYSGQKQLAHWNGSEDYIVCTSQLVTGLSDGLYSASVWVKSCGTQAECSMSVSEYGGGERKVDVPQSIQSWTQIRIDKIEVKNGQCLLSLYSDATAGEWACFDCIEIVQEKNYISNESFETGSGQNTPCWVTSSPNGTESASYIENGGHAGEKQLSHWSENVAYQVDTAQTIHEVPDGIYSLSAWVKSCGTQEECWMYVDDYGGELRKVRVPQSSQAWTQICIKDIEITSTSCEIGFWSNASAGEWMCVDDVMLIKETNYVNNGSFESEIVPDGVGWNMFSLNGTESSGYIEEGGCDGLCQLSFWNADTAYDVCASQLVAGLENGTYMLTAKAKSCGTQNACWIGVSDYGGSELRNSVAQSTEEWESICIRGIQVTEGQCKINIYTDAEAGEWSCFDNISLVRDNLEFHFLKGADMSMLKEMEDSGILFYEDGEQKDPLQALKENGFNCIRLKVWNDPGNPDYYPSDQSAPAGYNNKDHVLEMAERAHAMGFQIVLDFHYSDWWADKHKQYTPHEWEDLTLEQLTQAVYDYTFDVVNALKEKGIQPIMVQIGNEINAGILWDEGKIADGVEHWDEFAQLLRAGCRAVKDVSPEIQTVLHVDDGSDQEMCLAFYDNCIERGVQFDVIGLSYYTTWCGSLNDLSAAMFSLADRYGKFICVVENSQPWCPGEYTFTGETEKYPCTILGQKQFLVDLMNRIKRVPDGLGIGYIAWEPFWIENPQQEYQWNNGGFVDFSGNILDSIHIFRDN